MLYVFEDRGTRVPFLPHLQQAQTVLLDFLYHWQPSFPLELYTGMFQRTLVTIKLRFSFLDDPCVWQPLPLSFETRYMCEMNEMQLRGLRSPFFSAPLHSSPFSRSMMCEGDREFRLSPALELRDVAE